MQNKKRNFAVPFVLGMVSTFVLSVALLQNANAKKPLPSDSESVIIMPTAGTATVDGNTSEWNTSADFAATMCTAGSVNHETMECKDPGKVNLSNLYLRYDCDNDIMYVLVLKEKGYDVIQSADDAWFKIDGTKQLTNFAWVKSADGELFGYEGSFELAAGIHADVEVHLQFSPDDTSSTGKNQADKISIEVPEDCDIPPVDENEPSVGLSVPLSVPQGANEPPLAISAPLSVPQGGNALEPLLATDVNLTATLNGSGVDLTLTTSAEPDTAALLILRQEKRGNHATEITVVCEFPSGGSPYTCTDNVVGNHYRVGEIEYDGSSIVQNKGVKPKK